MATHPRKADGRRVVCPQCKQAQVARVGRQELAPGRVAFVNKLKHDEVAGADRSSAAQGLEKIPVWVADYNAVAPHSALGYRSPQQYRSTILQASLTC